MVNIGYMFLCLCECLESVSLSFSLLLALFQQNKIFCCYLEHCIDLESPKLNIYTAILIVSFSGHFEYAQSANHSCRQTQCDVCGFMHEFLRAFGMY